MRVRCILWLSVTMTILENVSGAQFFQQDITLDSNHQFNPVVSKSMTCEENSFMVQIEFKYPFYGIIYTENSNPRCIYVEGRKQPQRVYNFTVPNSEQCGSSITETSDTREIKNTLLVQRDPLLIERFDNSFTLLCQSNLISGTDGELQTMAFDRLQVLGPKVETIKKVVKTGRNNKIKFSGQILLGSGTDGPEVRNQVVQLGERLTYVFRCNMAGSQGEDCAVSQCYARDETGLTTVQLADANGCSLHPSFWSNFEQVSDSDLERVFLTSIWAWSFPSSDHVLISCRLRVCNGYCDRDQCPPALPRTQDYFQESPLALGKNSSSTDTLVSPQIESQYEALTGFSINRDFMEEARKDAPVPRLYPGNSLTYCVGKTAFVTVVTILITTLAIMTITVCLLLWRLHRFSATIAPSDCSSEPFYS